MKPSVIVLAALLEGQRVEIDGSLWCLGDDKSLCMVAHDDQGRERILRNPLPLSTFIYMCETVPNDKLVELSANAVLTRSC